MRFLDTVIPGFPEITASKESAAGHTAPLTTVALRRNLNKYCLWLLGVDMAETSKASDKQAPVPPGGGAAERRREFLAAREEPAPDAARPGGEHDSGQSEDQPGDPAAR